MTTIKNPKVIAIVTTALCMASLVWLMSTQRVNNSLERNFENEKLKSEALLSEKLLLEKDLEKMRGQLSNLKGINSELDQLVRNTEMKFESRESELNRLKKQNASLAEVKRQREELLRLQQSLEEQLLSMKASYAELENENLALSSAVARLQEQNRLLSDDLNRAMFASLDHLQVQAVKGSREKLTVKARKTSKLIANFDVPASLRSISFRVIDPKGITVSDKHGSVVFNAVPSEENIVASNAANSAGNGLQKVKMEFIPKHKMQAGVYTVEILNDNLYVGSLNVKLR